MPDDPNEKPPPKSNSENPLTQEAIAKRAAAIMGPEADEDRVAEAEEAKLASRRELQNRKEEPKTPLAEAASRQLAKIGTKKAVSRSRAAAAANPLLARTETVSHWIGKNIRWVASGVAVTLLIGGSLLAYSAVRKTKEANASVLLIKGIEAELGRIAPPPDDQDDNRPDDGLPVFKTVEEQRQAAHEKYREAQTRYPGTGGAILARLGEASLFLDEHNAEAAIEAYVAVKDSRLANVDAEVRGRALEGIGLALELKAQQLPDKSIDSLDAAIKAFRELENTDVKGFKELGMYHQARCLEAKAEPAQALELLKSARERIRRAGEGHPFPYLEEMVDRRLRALDPTAIVQPPPVMPGGRGSNSMSEAQIKELIEQLKNRSPSEEQGGGAPPPSVPPDPEER